jgi:hypothetical protein
MGISTKSLHIDHGACCRLVAAGGIGNPKSVKKREFSW